LAESAFHYDYDEDLEVIAFRNRYERATTRAGE
jgi:hypothetical protein